MANRSPALWRRWTVLLLCALAPAAAMPASAGAIETIQRIKGSVVAVGTFERSRSPQFQFLGTGFAVEDGSLIVTNAHVLPKLLEPAQRETLAILIPLPDKDDPNQAQVREARPVATDADSDLALLRISGPALPPLKLGQSGDVREGQEVLFTGYPIGAILGPHPATHRAIIAAVTPIAIPTSRAGELSPQTIRRLSAGQFPVFQLDATAYPGNSGSPLYDPATGEVIGVINKVFVQGTKEAALTQPSGITYAVPASHLRALLQRAR
ncbi:MAG TPA: serine protease [Casimicrobiaceae bacterium]|nr:serine protease [Casimicrobiaceae bacterium]